jgi:hypothetical protein
VQFITFCVGDDKTFEVIASPQFYLDDDGRILNGLTVLTDTSPDTNLDLGMVQPVLFALSLLTART